MVLQGRAGPHGKTPTTGCRWLAVVGAPDSRTAHRIESNSHHGAAQLLTLHDTSFGIHH
jgi:hypothetical protein